MAARTISGVSVRDEEPGNTSEISGPGRGAPAAVIQAEPEPIPDENVSAATEEPLAKAPGGRLPALDVLRGIAILGTFLANIWLFTVFDVRMRSRSRPG